MIIYTNLDKMKSVLLISLLIGLVKSQSIVPGVSDICFEQKASGPCRAFLPSIYYNSLTGTCDCFVFGGCQGNQNSFSSMSQCMSTCNVQPIRQTISQTCTRLFGSNTNPLIIPKQLGSSNTQNIQDIQQESDFDAPDAPILPFTLPSSTPITTTPVPARTPAPVVTSAPVVAPAPVQSTNIQKANLVSQERQSLSGGRVVSSTIHRPGGTSTGTLTIGQPVLISILRRNGNDDD